MKLITRLFRWSTRSLSVLSVVGLTLLTGCPDPDFVPGYCAVESEPCNLTDHQCCGFAGACILGVCGPVTVQFPGQSCLRDKECSSNTCQEGVCQCLPLQSACKYEDACCSNTCKDGVCVPADNQPLCQATGTSCDEHNVCCGGQACNDGMCPQNSCQEEGQPCHLRSDCCDSMDCSDDHVCQPTTCVSQGKRCRMTEDCCGGRWCIDGYCASDSEMCRESSSEEDCSDSGGVSWDLCVGGFHVVHCTKGCSGLPWNWDRDRSKVENSYDVETTCEWRWTPRDAGVPGDAGTTDEPATGVDGGTP